MRHLWTALAAALVIAAGACASGGREAAPGPAPSPAAARDTAGGDRPAYASTYRRHANGPVLIRNATILT
ncbi:MAG: hypothetical protein ACREME_10675, partial [Gemmatimonadales bacterium]